MNEIDKTNLTDQTKFRLNEISKIENYFNLEINQRKLCSKKLSKYLSAFDHIGKILIVLSATTGGVCISCNYCWNPCRNSKCWIYYHIFFGNRNNKKLLSTTSNKKKKHDKILMLAKSKLNSIETLVSLALIDMEISHGELLLF